MKDYKRSGQKTGAIILGIITGLILGLIVAFMPVQVDEEGIKETFEKDQHYLYFYEQLDESKQETYRRLLHAFTHSLESIYLDEKNVEVIQNVMSDVLYDHPELYYINDQFEYIKERQGIEFFPIYDYTQKEIATYNQKIKQKINPVISEAKKYKTASQQARYLYKYLIENVEYKENKKIDQNIISAFIEGKSVCAGYARAYQYLLAEADIKSAYIVGEAKDVEDTQGYEGHAWVMVRMENDFYYCDPTWGDVTEKPHPCYGYFMMSSDEMLKCYKPEVKYEKTKGQQHYYFDEEGCYLEEYDQKVISHAIQVGLANGSRVAEIKCGRKKVYEEIKNKLDYEYLGYDVLSENGCWSENSSYYCDDDLQIVEIYY